MIASLGIPVPVEADRCLAGVEFHRSAFAQVIDVAHVAQVVERRESRRVSVLNDRDYGDGAVAISAMGPAGSIGGLWARS